MAAFAPAPLLARVAELEARETAAGLTEAQRKALERLVAFLGQA